MNMMNPALFHIDWERTIEALVGIIILSFLVERACALLFESRWWISRFEDARVGKPLPNGRDQRRAPEKQPEAEKDEAAVAGSGKSLPAQAYPLKEFLAFAVALAICYVWDFDAVSIILLSERTQLIGIITTAAVVAGGSKASIKLFHNALGVRSHANAERKKLMEKQSQT